MICDYYPHPGKPKLRTDEHVEKTNMCDLEKPSMEGGGPGQTSAGEGDLWHLVGSSLADENSPFSLLDPAAGPGAPGQRVPSRPSLWTSGLLMYEAESVLQDPNYVSMHGDRRSAARTRANWVGSRSASLPGTHRARQAQPARTAGRPRKHQRPERAPRRPRWSRALCGSAGTRRTTPLCGRHRPHPSARCRLAP